jgi:hypothetical protein
MKCAWEQYYEMYQEAAAQSTVGRAESGFMDEVTRRMVAEHGSVREVSDPPEIWLTCQKCRALITMLDNGRFEFPGYCVEGKQKFQSLTELVNSKA